MRASSQHIFLSLFFLVYAKFNDIVTAAIVPRVAFVPAWPEAEVVIPTPRDFEGPLATPSDNELMMAGWDLKKGYPIMAKRADAGGRFDVRMKRLFRVDENEDADYDENDFWWPRPKREDQFGVRMRRAAGGGGGRFDVRMKRSGEAKKRFTVRMKRAGVEESAMGRDDNARFPWAYFRLGLIH